MAKVSTKTIRDWRAEGLDLEDVEAVLKRAAAVTGNDETLSEARRRRAVAAADAEEIRVRRLKGELCETRLARGVIEQLDLALCTVWKQAPNELAGILDGMSAGQMRNALIQWIDGTLIPRFATQVSQGIVELNSTFAELQKILPKQA